MRLRFLDRVENNDPDGVAGKTSKSALGMKLSSMRKAYRENNHKACFRSGSSEEFREQLWEKLGIIESAAENSREEKQQSKENKQRKVKLDRGTKTKLADVMLQQGGSTGVPGRIIAPRPAAATATQPTSPQDQIVTRGARETDTSSEDERVTPKRAKTARGDLGAFGGGASHILNLLSDRLSGDDGMFAARQKEAEARIAEAKERKADRQMELEMRKAEAEERKAEAEERRAQMQMNFNMMEKMMTTVMEALTNARR